MVALLLIYIGVLVVGEAIPLVKPDEGPDTVNSRSSLEKDNQDTLLIIDHQSSNGKVMIEDLPIKSKYKTVIRPDSGLSVILNRLQNVTSDLSSDMRKILVQCSQNNVGRSYKDFVICTKQHMDDIILSLQVSKKSLHAFNTLNLKSMIGNTETLKQISMIDYNASSQVEIQQNEIEQDNRTDDGEDEDDEFNDKHYITSSPNETMTKMNGKKSGWTQQYFPVSMTSCEHVKLYSDEFRWLWMVARCPRKWLDQNIRDLCEAREQQYFLSFIDDVASLPVQDENGTVYLNMQCAVCHNVHVPHPWTTMISCKNAPSEVLQRSTFEDMTHLYSYLTATGCQRQVIPAIPEAIKGCESDFLKVPRYTNRRLRSVSDSSALSYSTSFSVLFNFDFSGNTHILFSAGQLVSQDEYISRCQASETFDPYIQSCRPVSCSAPYKLVGNTCVQNDSVASSDDTQANLSQLHTQASIVSLTMNITFLDFIFMEFEDTKFNIALQIADQLSISVDRIQDMNVTYDYGSLSVALLHMMIVSEETYQKLFHQQPRQVGKSVSRNEQKFGQTRDIILESVRSELLRTEAKQEQTDQIDFTPGSDNSARGSQYHVLKTTTMKYNNKSKHTNETSLEYLILKSEFQGASNITVSRDLKIRKRSTILHANEELGYSTEDESDILKEETKVSAASPSLKNITFVRTNLKLAMKNRESSEGRTSESTFLQMSKRSDTEFYISSPINYKEDRVGLLVKGKHNVRRIVEQTMIMRLSFLLISNPDPVTKESDDEVLQQKIHNFTTDQQFIFTINGNKIEAMAAVDGAKKMGDQKKQCLWGVEYFIYGEEFTVINAENTTKLYVNKTNSFVDVGLFDLYIMVSGSKNAVETEITDSLQSAFICVMPRINRTDCSRIELPREQYDLNTKNKSIVFEENNYDMFSYRVLDENTGTIQICVPPFFLDNDRTLVPRAAMTTGSCGTDFRQALKTEGFMSLILGRVSTFALSCVIITYSVFRKLRTLPGLNTLSLTVCLLISQVLFTEGILESKHWLCETVAISLHYTLLSAHFWMNVMSFDAYKTFANPTILSRVRERSKYFPRYSFYAWGIPLVIVSFCVFVDFSGVFHGVSIGYGNSLPFSAMERNESYNNNTNLKKIKNSTKHREIHGLYLCWITKPLAALLAFGAVILIIFVANCIFFSKTIMSISKTTKMAKKIQHGNSYPKKAAGRSEVLLYVKMSSVMGFTWMFGLSSSIVSSFVKPATYTACIVMHVLSIFFIIFNSSQGIFIFMVFVCNRQVFGLYKGLVKKVKRLIFKSNLKENVLSISSGLSSADASNNTHGL